VMEWAVRSMKCRHRHSMDLFFPVAAAK
jgi:hypothetical protein